MDGDLELQLLKDIIESLTFCTSKLMLESQDIDLVINKVESLIGAIHVAFDNSPCFAWLTSILNTLENGMNVLLRVVDEPPSELLIGRPKLHVPRERLEYLLSLNFDVPDIAAMLCVSPKTVFRRFQEYGLSVSQTYAAITDDDLNGLVRAKLLELPNTGYKRMKGYLVADGVRVTDQRVREAMRIVDPDGVLERTKSNRAIVRRQYFVPYSNSIWHLDGNHKLIRYKIVVRAGIDGKSRTVTYILASEDNRADTHLSSFLKRVEKYGCPLRCRSDKGGENVLIARFMLENRGLSRGSHIVGRSVHNQRIERLWRDVFSGCLAHYYNVFTTMENDGILNIHDDRHLFILHKIFLPRLNRHLATFCDGWNRHPLSTESNYSPAQLLLMNLPPPDCDLVLPSMDVGDININNLNQFNEFEEPILNSRIPDSCLSSTDYLAIDQINPLQESNYYGYDLFVQALQCLNTATCFD